MIDFLNWLLEDFTMLAVWGTLLVISVFLGRKTHDVVFRYSALACVPMMTYFTWAATGLWSSHELATAFNRSAQVMTVFILMLGVAHLGRRYG